VVTAYALAFPDVAFTMRLDGREAFQAQTGNFQERLASVFGRDAARQMLPFERHDGALALRGAVSRPGLHKSTRDGMLFFVNRRWITSASLGHALLTAYHTLLPTQRYPLAVLFLEIPPDTVDVNVHPTKREVKFRSDREIYDAVVRSVRATLLETADSPSSNGTPITPPMATFMRESLSSWGLASQAMASLKPPTPYEAARSPRPEGAGAAFSGNPSAFRTLDPAIELSHFVQMFSTFIVFQSDSELFVADQHTVHERLNYEKFMQSLKKHDLEIQPLLVPETVELDPRQARLVHAHLETLKELGLEVEPFGGNTFVIKAVPADLPNRKPTQMLKDLADTLASEDGNAVSLDRIRERVATFLACRSSVMAGDVLNEDQMKGLIQRMRDAKLPFTCPHGRPTILSIPLADLYRKFERH